MESSKLQNIEKEIIHLSEKLEKLLNGLKLSLEGKENDFSLDDNEFEYKDKLVSFKEDKNPKITLAIYIFNLIDNIRKEMNESVDSIYSKNTFVYVPNNSKELNEKLIEKEKLRRDILHLIN